MVVWQCSIVTFPRISNRVLSPASDSSIQIGCEHIEQTTKCNYEERSTAPFILFLYMNVNSRSSLTDSPGDLQNQGRSSARSNLGIPLGSRGRAALDAWTVCALRCADTSASWYSPAVSQQCKTYTDIICYPKPLHYQVCKEYFA